MNRHALIAAALLAACASPAFGKTTWAGKPRPYLEARPSADEADATVRASCAFDGVLTLRLGADIGVGEGKGEPVSVKIESGGKSVKVQGVSRNSPDSEMTGGTELATDLPLNDPAVEILFSGKAVTLVTPDQKKHPLVDADAAGAAKKFLKQCRGG
ncbi:hypothetical protein ACNHKD_12070 [Methylocystis sp. JAN1]|uniref:hypothetical protein n=1 Tax=Methylocystis sp. JAN1 TaxID=3397211 RepID=UPI003FA317BF